MNNTGRCPKAWSRDLLRLRCKEGVYSQLKPQEPTLWKLWSGWNQLGRRGADTQQGSFIGKRTRAARQPARCLLGTWCLASRSLSPHVVWPPHLTPLFLVTDWQLRANLKKIQFDREENSIPEALVSLEGTKRDGRAKRGLLKVRDKNDWHMLGFY